MGLKEEILAIEDRKSKVIKVPEWKNKSIKIRSWSAAERDTYETLQIEAAKNKQPIKNPRAVIAAFSIVDDEGNRVFSEDDIEALSKKSAKALDRIYDVIIELNKLTEEEAKEYEKNS